MRVNIRPGVSVLSVLRHLNYKPWFALAEFVDNSLQSFLTARDELLRAHGNDYRLRVAIKIDNEASGRIVIRDNAAGIREADYARAFRAAEIPPDRSGLSEFGMGMKSAACWFSPHWSVRTSALGETVEKIVRFDIDRIVRDSIEELEVEPIAVGADVHFTEVTLEQLYKIPQSRTVKKIEEHLASIYRHFLRDGTLELAFNDDLLTYETPRILVAAFHRDASGGERKEWRKEIDFDFGLGQRTSGFAALRERASTSHAGFALFRRGRLIEGSADETYRPEAIFGSPNSYRYQRLFGELHLEGFDVSHTKDGFAWDEHEETFLALLKEHLDADPLPLLDQAEGLRVRQSRAEIQQQVDGAATRTAGAIERDVPATLERLETAPPAPEPNEEPSPLATPTISRRVIEVDLRGARWHIVLELTEDPGMGDWIELWDAADHAAGVDRARVVGVRMSLQHPFVHRFAGPSYSQVEPLVRFAAALALGETAARDAGVQYAGTIRRNINELLRNGLAAE